MQTATTPAPNSAAMAAGRARRGPFPHGIQLGSRMRGRIISRLAGRQRQERAPLTADIGAAGARSAGSETMTSAGGCMP